MRIAVAQIACALGDPLANLEKIRAFAQRAKDAGAELVLFPEMADTGYDMATIKRAASSWDRGAVPALREIAQNLSLTVICGVSEREADRLFNTQIIVDATGEIAAKYRKTHLFAPAPIHEDECITRGEELAVFVQHEFRFGLSICYDLRFPEFYRALALGRMANVFLNSSAWPFPRTEHLRILAAARAIENQSYLVLANRVGTDAGVTFCGGSAIIDPTGTILAAAAEEGEELIVAELSANLLERTRAAMPVFAHRRPDVYAAAGFDP
ncbi:MAG: nitrilase-related carbon-nitrogen hydrolase [Chthoniobacterales bacterium]